MSALVSSKAKKKSPMSHFQKREGVPHSLLVVYEVRKGEWRGFVHPYGETTEASSKKEALKKLHALASAYYKILSKYDFPLDLTNGHMENVMDRNVFGWVVGSKEFMNGVHSKAGKFDSEFCYVEAYGGEPK